MKVILGVLLCLLYLGLAWADFYQLLQDSNDDVVESFIDGMNVCPHLREVLADEEYSAQAELIEGDFKSELGNSLREALEDVESSIKVSFNNALVLLDEMVKKTKLIFEQLKEVTGNEMLRGRLRERIQLFVEKTIEQINNLLANSQGLEEEFEIQNLLKRVEQKFAGKVTIQKALDYVRNLFGDSSLLGQVLLRSIKSHGLDALQRLILSVLPSSTDLNVNYSDYGIKDMWKKVKDFVGDVAGNLGAKFSTFGNWIKGVASSGFGHIKDKAQRLKAMAQSVIDNAKTLTSEAAHQAWDYFQEHKSEIGLSLMKKLGMALLQYGVTAAIG